MCAEKPDFIYAGEQAREISFPLGGIGTGCIGLGGNGRLIDWEIYNRPNKGSLNGMSHFAVKAEQDGRLLDARVLTGDLKKDLAGQYGGGAGHWQCPGYGFGADFGTMAGFPHFSDCRFKGTFPIAELVFSDPHFPGSVTMTAFNPFIPLDADASGMPAAFFEIELENPTAAPVTYTVALSAGNCFSLGAINNGRQSDGVSYITLEQNVVDKEEPRYGSITAATDGDEVRLQEYWFRGAWFDGPTIFWKEFTDTVPMPERKYEQPGNRDMATLTAAVIAGPGEKRTVRFIIAWYFPNNLYDWAPIYAPAPDQTLGGSWKNYYAGQYASSAEVAIQGLQQWDSLYGRTRRFTDTLFSSTLPPEVLDAASANLAVLKSPTVWRLEDGTLYGFEGVSEHCGSCEGSCTHVWNYAYAMPFLFPRLERSMHTASYRYDFLENGRMSFRILLPLGKEPLPFHPCVDGQMGEIMRVYRDWKLCGDDDWLRSIWPRVKQSLEYAWHPQNPYRWDADKDGVIDGRQHHTLDMELFGPNSWLEGFYLGALNAAAEMADYLGEADAAAEYRGLYANGRRFCNEILFNGKYFEQKVDLRDKAILERYGQDAVNAYWNEESGEMKYQIDHGCSIDQMTAQWHARIIGLDDIFDEDKRKKALESLYHYNYKSCMRDFFNPCRVFCTGDEAGAVICDYPDKVKKPAVPVPYCQECMTGFEYQLAALMISEGMQEEGLRLVRAVRGRYDGKKRNPWNEVECGSNYARSMASYSLLLLYSGFRFDLPHGMIGFSPLYSGDEPFRCLWSVDSAWGSVSITQEKTVIQIEEGQLAVQRLELPYLSGAVCVTVDGKAVQTAFKNGGIDFPVQTAVRQAIIVSRK